MVNDKPLNKYFIFFTDSRLRMDAKCLNMLPADTRFFEVDVMELVICSHFSMLHFHGSCGCHSQGLATKLQACWHALWRRFQCMVFKFYVLSDNVSEKNSCFLQGNASVKYSPKLSYIISPPLLVGKPKSFVALICTLGNPFAHLGRKRSSCAKCNAHLLLLTDFFLENVLSDWFKRHVCAAEHF